MKKYMKKHLFRLYIFAFVISVISFLSSCEQKIDADYDEAFQEGVQYGESDMFLRLYNSIGFENEQILLKGDTWKTEHFSLIIHDTINDDEAYITYDLTLKNTTIGDCIETGNFFFNVYAFGDTEGIILDADNFVWDGALYCEGSQDDYLKGNNVKGRFELLDNSEKQSIIIIIATKGFLYSATYYT